LALPLQHTMALAYAYDIGTELIARSIYRELGLNDVRFTKSTPSYRAVDTSAGC
jgi:hypothetical protein